MIISVNAQEITRRHVDSLLLQNNLTGTNHINSLLELAEFYTHLRHPLTSQLDSAAYFIIQSEQLNGRSPKPNISNHIALMRAALYKAKGELKMGQSLLERTIVNIRESRDKPLLGKAYFELSEYYSQDFLQQSMISRIYYLNKAVNALEGTNHLVELARCYRLLADLHQMKNDYTQSFAEAKKALANYRLARYTETQGIYALMGRLYYTQGDYKKAIDYELMALKMATESSADNVRLLCQINNNLGYDFVKLGDSQKALMYFSRALDIAKSEKDNITIYLLAGNIVDVYLRSGQAQKAKAFLTGITQKFVYPKKRLYEGGDGVSQTYLKIYLALKQYDIARQYCDELIIQTKNPNLNLYSRSGYYELIIKFYIGIGRFSEALKYLKMNQDLLQKVGNENDMGTNDVLWFSLDTAQRNYQSAINHLTKANAIKDSVFNLTKSKQIEQLQIEFETQQKEAQITLLNQKSRLERANLQQANVVKNFTIGGIFLLLVIAMLLYRQNLHKQKSNEIITSKNTLLEDLLKQKEWLLKEVHHRVKNNLQIVMSILNTQSAYLQNDIAIEAIKGSQHRVNAIALLHQKLYSGGNIALVSMPSYISELINYLSDSFDTGFRHIKIIQASDPLNLDPAQAVPIGLILNEAITNAIKYAFDRRGGEILVSLAMHESGNAVLKVSDTGKGLPPDFDFSETSSLGMEMMKALGKQLKGKFTVENDSGVTLTIIFPIEQSRAEVFAEKGYID
ncbi:tetratricopeptide repeat-containing sensor histidine kinase [Mucilaginibacter aquaedulcis]|uniref:tetratricopeptide repeat-containing sensor histidine kinase n=1 Tax=Mucilaginibacter aquaedulcis TaxID=1187081 RepID=UPI0025B4961E|nr:histidine kinase dimerization/phosphoacceptor domain -containing protein [Mucilaginibacter aquaedulcis]MDN3548607.1 histidine kinase dimerization/phosphoacceptor domain -containing protein [Mucilaginibacter aquaedulcis]